MTRQGATALLFLAVLGGAFVSAPTPARAQFEYCNDTSFFLFTALGREGVDNAVRTEGWWLLRPGQCRTVITQPLTTDTVYTYAESHPAHLGGIRTWAGRSRLCTGPGLFDIDLQGSCFQQGFEPRDFTRIQIGEETQWTTRFTENDDYEPEEARLAGAQRLLTDVGYEPGSIDGYIGRRTRRAITRFKDDFEIEDDTIVSDLLLDELISYASELQEHTGYQFCNETDIELFAAMGYADESEWLSFGWWELAPGTCTKTLKDGLPAEQIYTYAVGYTPDGETLEFAGDYPLCAADQAFEITGTADCESRGYMTLGFERQETAGNDGFVHAFRLRPPLGAENGVMNGLPEGTLNGVNGETVGSATSLPSNGEGENEDEPVAETP